MHLKYFKKSLTRMDAALQVKEFFYVMFTVGSNRGSTNETCRDGVFLDLINIYGRSERNTVSSVDCCHRNII